MSDVIKIEIRDGDFWRLIGEVKLLEDEGLGPNASSEFSYDLDYAIAFSDRIDFRAASVLMPVTTIPLSFEHWPAFLLDLFPQGAALRYVVDEYRIADKPENYWKILKTARLNPPGNLRVAQSGPIDLVTYKRAEGFRRDEVVAKGEYFLEHMIKAGAPVAGTTGAGGAAPKFLLREDHSGRFYADGVLDDSKTRQCWLVKFPRGRKKVDCDILFAEMAYHKIAKRLGINTHEELFWEKDCLFVPRFDRFITSSKIEYYGLESFYSMVGHSEFGSRLRHETYLGGLHKFSSDAQADIIEYCLRDFLNQMLGNTDNHGRNQSLLKKANSIRLSPLYDFAPMKFDPEGIVRNTRWEDDIEEGNLEMLTQLLVDEFSIDINIWHHNIRSFTSNCKNLDAMLRREKVSPIFIDRTEEQRKFFLQRLKKYCEDLE